jgi:purine nucleoside permease
MFERGADTGDGVPAVLTGVGTAKSAAAIMALGMDPRFDLTHAYWPVAGIAGINPARGSLGSVAWAEWVVDGDLAREIDAREIPSDWRTGYLPLRGSVPYQQPRDSTEGEVYHLEPGLVDWAFHLTEHVPLAVSEAMQAARSGYSSVNARRTPFVMKGDTLSSETFWHGKPQEIMPEEARASGDPVIREVADGLDNSWRVFDVRPGQTLRGFVRLEVDGIRKHDTELVIALKTGGLESVKPWWKPW